MKIPLNTSEKNIKLFFKKIGLEKILNLSNDKKNLSVYPPNLNDLYFIYKFIILNKRLKILEFGTGFSSLILSMALKSNAKKYGNINFKEFGLINPFSHFIVDDQKKYINISKRRIEKFSSKDICKPIFKYSPCKLILFNNLFTNSYESLPNIVPDFIYLDGPDTNMINNSIGGINVSKKEIFPPLSIDILKIEYYLNPGTIIVVDGRYANSIFLKNNLQRNWIYKYNSIIDQHYFYLNEKKIGIKSRKLINFYNS
tara:strand:+ start:416 stop:1183 length:768 start_codon:yes stop_codon:yes gene_type:complete